MSELKNDIETWCAVLDPLISVMLNNQFIIMQCLSETVEDPRIAKGLEWQMVSTLRALGMPSQDKRTKEEFFNE